MFEAPTDGKMREAQQRLTPWRKSGDEFVGEAYNADDTQNRVTIYFVIPILSKWHEHTIELGRKRLCRR